MQGRSDDKLTYPILIAEVKTRERMTCVPKRGYPSRQKGMRSKDSARI